MNPPPYVLVRVRRPDGLALPEAICNELTIGGVPKQFFERRYHVADELSALDGGSHGQWIRFGSTGHRGAMVVDVATHQVLTVVAGSGFPPVFVNASLNAFRNVIRRVIEQFPLKLGQDPTDQELEECHASLAEVIESVDPAASESGTFWGTFLEDVLNGDFNDRASV